MTKARYFLAIIPPEPIFSEVENIKKQFALDYQSKAALRSPAHITLHMPFLWNETKENRLINKLAQAISFEKFDIDLNGFGAFPPKTIFVKNDYCDALMRFQKALATFMKTELNLFNATHNRGYHPHMTVAFRDLKKEKFEEAWQVYKNEPFKATFQVQSFWLLKHNGKRWEAYQEFNFK